MFKFTRVRCSARSARTHRCIAPISASLPIPRLNSDEFTRVREAKRPVVPKHGSPEGLEAASRRTQMTRRLVNFERFSESTVFINWKMSLNTGYQKSLMHLISSKFYKLLVYIWT
uniref:Uncharacterized protein n=1 Tax=Trichogramma kaykai TaxID=54128 RepID=A0ABD2VXP5_9HYME